MSAGDRSKGRSAGREPAIRLIILRAMMKMIRPVEKAASK